MFPPLCFIDVTKGQVAYDETEKKMKEACFTDNGIHIQAEIPESLRTDEIVFKIRGKETEKYRVFLNGQSR